MIYSDKALRRMAKPWQDSRGERYGNRRKEIARLKWKARKAERRDRKKIECE